MDLVIPRHKANFFVPGTLMIFEEKHGTRYFAAGSIKEAGKVCRKILKERHGEYWEKEPQMTAKEPEFKKENIPSLPKSLQEEARRQWSEYESELNWYNREVKFVKKVEEVLKTDSDYAVSLVISRSDYEYETVRFDMLEDVD